MSTKEQTRALVVMAPSGQRFTLAEPSSLSATNQQQALTGRDRRLSEDYRHALATQEGHARLAANADDIIDWHKDHTETLFVGGLVRSERRLAQAGLTWMQPLAEGMIVEISQQTKLLHERNHEALGYTVTQLANRPLYQDRQETARQVGVGWRDAFRGSVTVMQEE